MRNDSPFWGNHLFDWAETLPISAPSVRFPKNFEALPGFFFRATCQKKAWYSLENFGKSHRCCRYWHMQSFSPIGQVVPSERAVISQRELSSLRGIDCIVRWIFTKNIRFWLQNYWGFLLNKSSFPWVFIQNLPWVSTFLSFCNFVKNPLVYIVGHFRNIQKRT